MRVADRLFDDIAKLMRCSPKPLDGRLKPDLHHEYRDRNGWHFSFAARCNLCDMERRRRRVFS